MDEVDPKRHDLCDVNGCDENAEVVVDTGLHWREISLCPAHGRVLKSMIDDNCARVGLFLVTGTV